MGYFSTNSPSNQARPISRGLWVGSQCFCIVPGTFRSSQVVKKMCWTMSNLIEIVQIVVGNSAARIATIQLDECGPLLKMKEVVHKWRHTYFDIIGRPLLLSHLLIIMFMFCSHKISPVKAWRHLWPTQMFEIHNSAYIYFQCIFSLTKLDV